MSYIPLSLYTIALLGAALTLLSFRNMSSQTTVQFGSQPAIISVKSSDESEELESASIRELVEAKCPSLFKPFKPVWWLCNGHLQTVHCVTGDFSKIDPLQYNRTYLRLVDGGTLGLDFAPAVADESKVKPDTPIIVVQHGLTGGSYEPYVRAIVKPACTPVEEGGLGYRVVVVNFRGCAGTPITSQQLYSAGHTDDLRQALAYLEHRYPSAPLLGLGYSLGANVLTRYIAEEGENSRLISGCALACPWDLEENNHSLLNSFLGTQVYQKGMGGNLQRLVRKHQESLLIDPEHRVAKAVPGVLALKKPTLAEFDEAFTRIAGGSAPTFPFPDADAYYRWASSHKVLKDVRVPFLAINATDDPVVHKVPMSASDNPYVTMVLTGGGGHLGWFQSGDGITSRWFTEPVLEWMKLTEALVLPSKLRNPPSTYVDEEGFVCEQGRPHLGSKVIPGGGIVDGNGGEAGALQGL
ncbi:AB-hydrolase YheT [Pluteus cervinus]|uniref:AB-hydrolase YheT n=1 Tax=Pluteus cervinus TaxID=181527 RepID=A0ACD3BFS4_9AGAR|nr:AB-hydrolase YheT [Pluteus cervinus]